MKPHSAIHAATLAARNAGFRGASGLSRHLRGELVTLHDWTLVQRGASTR